MTTNGERRKPTPIQWVNAILPTIIFGVLSWTAVQLVQMKVDITKINGQIIGLRKDITNHADDTKLERIQNSIMHHRKNNQISPCDGCHKGLATH